MDMVYSSLKEELRILCVTIKTHEQSFDFEMRHKNMAYNFYIFASNWKPLLNGWFITF